MRQILPMPRNVRDLIELFSIYEPQIGIHSVLSAFDSSELTRATVFTAVLGGVSEQRLNMPTSSQYHPRAHMRNLLESAEFRAQARRLIVDAFPEKRRIIFVHIPKCAGSDMSEILFNHFPALPSGSFVHTASNAEGFFAFLRKFSLGLRYGTAIALTGHTQLKFYQNQNFIREQDFIFTILRDPASIVYSFVNYVLTICKTAKTQPRGDTPTWLEFLGITEIPEDASPEDMLILARRALYKENTRNTMCTLLGDGDLQGSLAQVIATNIEITDTSRYQAWRETYFPNEKITRHNASESYFTPDNASPADRDYIAQITTEDQKLYALVQARLAKTGKLSLRGNELG